MDCKKCSVQLFDYDQLLFYVKNDKEVSLNIKENRREAIFEAKIICTEKEGKKIRAKCGKCNSNLGRQLPFGPENTNAGYIAFGIDKVKLSGKSFSRKDRWAKLYLDYKDKIEIRDSNSFHGALEHKNIQCSDVSSPPTHPAIVFPSSEKLLDFEWFSVLSEKANKPRNYQIEAFVEVLQGNIILTLPTGAGKTLVASMFLSKMRRLNPNLMGVMIVNRVPLVFQQKKAIENDTDLNVFCLCGENKTRYMVEKLRKNKYDVLVITAGAFMEMIEKNEINVNYFCAVVFDECHHVTGNHCYVKVLNQFKMKAENLQPRILGLTASPINHDDEKQLGKFMENFPSSTKIFCPDIPEANNITFEEMNIRRLTEQNDMINLCVEKLNAIIKKVSDVTSQNITVMNPDLSNDHIALGELKSIKIELSEYYEGLNEIIDDGIFLIRVINVCDIMGVPSTCVKLKERFPDIWKRFCDITTPSLRLQYLHSTIESLDEKSKLLIFVSTREIVRILTKNLNDKFCRGKKKDERKSIYEIVGHGGSDGMNWEEDQRKIIEAFSRENSDNGIQILISTSVLEEGINISACDFVICFSGVRSLIQHIQARGRARKVNSRFIVYQSESEQMLKQKIGRQEVYLKAVILKQQNTFYENNTRHIIKEIQDNFKELKQNDRMIKFDNKKYDFSFFAYMEPIPGKTKDKIKEKLAEVLEGIQEFKLNRLENVKNEVKDDFLARRVLHEETVVFLVGVQTQNGSSRRQCYLKFCQTFLFNLKNEKQNFSIWTNMKSLLLEKELTVSGNVNISSFQLGSFLDSQTFGFGSSFEDKEHNMEIIFDSKDKLIMKYYNKYNNRDEQVTIDSTCIGDFALMSFMKQEFTVYLQLKQCPVIDHVQNVKGEVKLTRLNILDNNYVVTAFSYHSVLSMNFDNSHQDRVFSMLKSMFNEAVFQTAVEKKPLRTTSNIQQLQITSFIEDTLWALNCLRDGRSMLFTDDIYSTALSLIISNQSDQERLNQVIVDISNPSSHTYFSKFDDLFFRTNEAYLKIPSEMLSKSVAPNHQLVKRLVVTPLRTITLPPVPVLSNRLLLNWGSLFSFVVVSFKDEDFSKIQTVELLPRIRECIENGIEIVGKRYQFLLSTASQLREHKAYFIDANEEVIIQIREQIIPLKLNKKFASPVTYLSRLGLYGTAVEARSFDMSFEDRKVIDDLYAENGDLLTDGAGKIALSKAQEISSALGLAYTPSAFQIRYSGVKGVLVTTQDNDKELYGNKFVLRKSMVKFQNDDSKLYIVHTSKFHPFMMNRQIITLLSCIPSSKFVKDLEHTLLEYQEIALIQYYEMFNNTKTAVEELRNYPLVQDVNSLSSSHVELLEEKYWLSILQGIYRLRVRDIKIRAKIPIKQGCLLMGIPDPYGELKEGEVFVQINRPSGEKKVIEDTVMVFRNPCLHPGDFRVVKAINKNSLHYLVNVIVFPVTDCKESLPASCSGGDLDGDLYAIIWDNKIIPPKDFCFPPCRYSDIAKSNEVQKNKSIDLTRQETFAESFVSFISNDCVGRISHKHLALCDLQQEGARDSLAIKLAKSQVQAFDYPKTGIIPQIPKASLELVKTFPDFMEKPPDVTHFSDKILGKLYRRCRSLTYRGDISDHIGTEMNMHLSIEGSNDFIHSSLPVYYSYASDMKVLMRRFHLKFEADVILGEATAGWNVHVESDRGKAMDVIQQSYASIVRKYRKIFFEDINHDDKNKMWRKASAWYRLVNDSTLKKIKKRRKFLSFPWVVHDVICDISRQIKFNKISQRLINIGKLIMPYFMKNANQLKNAIDKKQSKLDIIKEVISKTLDNDHHIISGFSLKGYGSTSIYLCELDSDIDICILAELDVLDRLIPEKDKLVLTSLKDKKRYFLRHVVFNAINKVSLWRKTFLDKDCRVPLIKCLIGEERVNCDITMNKVGYLKTLYILSLYGHKDDGYLYLPLFWSLLRWARISGIVRSIDSASKIIDTADFYALIIYALNLPHIDISLDKPLDGVSFVDLYEKCIRTKGTTGYLSPKQQHRISKMLLEFFQNVYGMKGKNVNIKWPASEIDQIIHIDASKMEEISTLAGRAVHVLSATRDFEKVLSYFSEMIAESTEINLPLSDTLAVQLGTAPNFHATRLKSVFGATVTIQEEDGKLRLKAQGNRLAINNIRNEMKYLEQTNKAIVLGRIPQKSSRYFMEGSSCVMVSGCLDSSESLSFTHSFGPHESHHSIRGRTTLYLDNPPINKNNWKEIEVQRFHNHLWNQFQCFPRDNNDLLNSLEITCRFGSFYLLDTESRFPDIQTSLEISQLQVGIEKGRRTRKSWLRREFTSHEQRQQKSSSDTEIEMVNIPTPKSGRIEEKKRFQERMKKRILMCKRKRVGISAGFTPGLLKDNTKDESAIEDSYNVFKKALKRCGFKLGEPVTMRTLPPDWKVSVNPSSNYEVQVNLDDKLQILKIAERPLHWVHGTIIDGRKQDFKDQLLKNCDIRFLISTEDKVLENTDLYLEVLPNGQPPITLDKCNKPVLAERKKTSMKRDRNKNVSMVRNVQSCESFTNGLIDASIAKGYVYSDLNMVTCRRFCDLSLYFNSAPLQEAIKEHLNDTLQKVSHDIFTTALKVKEELDAILADDEPKKKFPKMSPEM